MAVEIRREPISSLHDYATTSIAFVVDEIFDVIVDASNAFTLVARRLDQPYVKDYDLVSEPPAQWAQRFDISNWAVFGAFENGARIGGATIACRTPDVDMLEGRSDLAVLWDMRVEASSRRFGVGAALFKAAADWASANGHRELKIETQNVNVDACRFYARQGCVLRHAHPGAYPDLPDEVQLLWYKNLD